MVALIQQQYATKCKGDKMAASTMNDLLALEADNPFLKYMPESANDLIGSPTPQSLLLAYRTGTARGVIVDDVRAPEFARRAARYTLDGLAALREGPLIWEESPSYRMIAGRAKEVGFNFGWKNWLRMDPAKASKGNQATGDCVSWAVRGARDRLRCNHIADGAVEAYVERQATCGIYSGRGHTGQGANPGMLSEFAVKIGTLLEKEYLDGKYDFRNYDSYVQWGMSRGRVGMPDDLLELTRDYTDERTYLVKTWDGFVDAIAADCTVHAGSMLGVASSGNPISRESGSWSHDMDYPGFDITRDHVGEDVVFGDNSWGDWNSVSNIPEAWKPWAQGMFVITRSTFERRVLPANGTWVFVAGKYFPGKPINNLLI